jgi:Ni/Co efflux regulator RcnB
MPPGQAKKWAIGRPLPRNVIYYDLPPALIGSIRMPPAGYRFLRVANDILMISIGTGMVMDAINNPGAY